MALDAKKVYIYGEKDKDMPIVQKLEGIQKVSIPQSGHFVMNDNPEEFYTTLANIL